MMSSAERILPSLAAIGLLFAFAHPLHAQMAEGRLPGDKTRMAAKERMAVITSAHLVPVEHDGKRVDGILISYRIPYSALSFRRAVDASEALADVDVVVKLFAQKTSDIPRERDMERMKPIMTRTENLFISERDLDGALKEGRSMEGSFIIALDGDVDAPPPAFVLPVVEVLNPGREPRRSQLTPLKMDQRVQFIPVKPLDERDSTGNGRISFDLSTIGQAVTYGEDIALLMIIRQDTQGNADDSDPSGDGGGGGGGGGGWGGFSVEVADTQSGTGASDTLREEILVLTGSGDLVGERWMWIPSVGRVSTSSDSAGAGSGAARIFMHGEPGMETGWSALYAVVPGGRFPNAPLHVTLHELDGGADDAAGTRRRAMGRTTLSSRWDDMPASLLSLDRALNDMGLLLGDEEVKRLSKAGRAKKLERFNSYWAPKDPTPETHYNEVMTEYFRRIDAADQRYSTPSIRGSSSDQGKTFIIHGEPDRIDREFPSGSPAVERWTYREWVFVFEATTGFGDFKLKERRTL